MKLAMIILAAGFSRRMGVLKPLLPVGGQCAILRCIDTAKCAGVCDFIAVTGHSRERIEAAVRDTGVRIVYNERYTEGMFSSVYAGALGLAEDIDGFFILPADCCAVTESDLLTLIDVFVKNGGESVVRPRYGGRRGHPPLIPIAFLSGLLAYSGENGLKGFLAPLPTVEVLFDNPGVLLDMDTPEDFVELLKHLALPIYPDTAQCVELLVKENTPPDIIAHGRMVADTALKIAALVTARGGSIDNGLLESACLLHDIKRMEPNHARAGMELLLREGYPAAAIVVGEHMEPQGAVTDIGESELLYLADKLCRGDKLVKIEDSLSGLLLKYGGNPEAIMNGTARLEHALCILRILRERYNIDYYDFL